MSDPRRAGRRRWWLAATLLVLLVISVGCDDDDGPSLECGDGTSEDDGVCLADPVDTTAPPSIECGAGTVLSGGRCVPIVDPGLACGPGTVLEQTRCVPINNAQCGSGTRVIPTREGDELIDYCVGDIVCGEGTYANLEGECIPDFLIVCGEGTVEHEGECLDQIAALEQLTPLTAMEPDGPGQAPGFELAAESGNTVLLEGYIETPIDLDGDAQPDQDVDWFTFSAEAGAVIELRAFANGLPAPFVSVVGVDPDTRFFTREIAILSHDQLRRDIVLPAAGLYSVRVTDQFAPGETAVSTSQPIGSPDYGYFVTVTTRPSLEASDATDARPGDTLDGVYSDAPRDRLWKVTSLQDVESLVARVVADGDVRVGAIMVFDDTLSFVYELRGYDIGDALPLDVPTFVGAEASAYVLIDWVRASGSAVVDTFSIDLDALAPVSLPLDDGESLGANAQQAWSLGAFADGELVTVHVSATASGDDEAIEVELVEMTSRQVVARRRGAAQVDLAWFASSGGELALTVRNLRGESVPIIVSVGSAAQPVPPTLDATTATTAMTTLTGVTPSAAGWFVLDVADEQSLGLELGVAPVTAGGDPRVTLWTQDDRNVYPAGDFPRGESTVTVAATSPQRQWLIGRVEVLSATDVDVTATVDGGVTVGTTNNRCEGALDLGTSSTAMLSIPLSGLTNRISPLLANTCHAPGTERVDGADAFVVVEVPPASMLVAQASGTGRGADPAVELVELAGDDCGLLGGEPTTEWLCLDAVHDVGGTSDAIAHFLNDGVTARRVLVVVDNAMVGPYAAEDLNLVALSVVAAP